MLANNRDRQTEIAMLNSTYGINGKKPFEQLCKDLDLEYIRVQCDGPLGGYTLYFRSKDGKHTISRKVTPVEIYSIVSIDRVIEEEIRDRFAIIQRDGGFDRQGGC
jgi:hypothetical protein